VGYFAPVARARLLRWNSRAGLRAASLVNAAALVAVLSGSGSLPRANLRSLKPARSEYRHRARVSCVAAGWRLFSADHHGGY